MTNIFTDTAANKNEEYQTENKRKMIKHIFISI